MNLGSVGFCGFSVGFLRFVRCFSRIFSAFLFCLKCFFIRLVELQRCDRHERMTETKLRVASRRYRVLTLSKDTGSDDVSSHCSRRPTALPSFTTSVILSSRPRLWTRLRFSENSRSYVRKMIGVNSFLQARLWILCVAVSKLSKIAGNSTGGEDYDLSGGTR